MYTLASPQYAPSSPANAPRSQYAPFSPCNAPTSPAYHPRTGGGLQPGNLSGDEAALQSAEDCLRMLEGEPGTSPFWLSDLISAT